MTRGARSSSPPRSAWLRLRAEGDEARHLLVTRSGRILVRAVAAIALLTVIGMAALWPYGWESPPNSATRTVGATVELVIDEPCGGGDVMCRNIGVRVEGRQVTIGPPHQTNGITRLHARRVADPTERWRSC